MDDADKKEIPENKSDKEPSCFGMNLYKSEKLSKIENPGEDSQNFLKLITQVGKDWDQMDEASREDYEVKAKAEIYPDEKFLELPQSQDNLTLPSFSYGKLPPPPELEPQVKNLNVGSGWTKGPWDSSKLNDDDLYSMGNRRNHREKRRGRGSRIGDGWGEPLARSRGASNRKRERKGWTRGFDMSSSSDDENTFEIDDEFSFRKGKSHSPFSRSPQRNTKSSRQRQLESEIAHEVEDVIDDVLGGGGLSSQTEKLIDSVSLILRKEAKKLIGHSGKSHSKSSRTTQSKNNSPSINFIYPGVGKFTLSTNFIKDGSIPNPSIQKQINSNLSQIMSQLPMQTPMPMQIPNPMQIQNPMMNPMQNPMMNPMMNPMQNPMMNPMQNPMMNPMMGPIPNPMMSPMQNPMMNPMQNPMMNPMQNPMMNPMQNPMMNPMQNPMMNPMQNPMMNPMQNPMMNPMQNPMMNPMQNPMMNPMQIPNYFPSNSKKSHRHSRKK